MVFASVLATGAVTGAWGDGVRALADPAEPVGARAGAELNGSAPGGSTDGARHGAEPGARSGAAGAPGARGGHAHDADELVSRSGDRWSASYTAQEYEGLRRNLRGEYVGVGISVRQVREARGAGMAVARVQPGSPAAEAGIRAGDRLRAVDGVAVADRPVTEVVSRLRGSGSGKAEAKPGSEAVLDLGRDGRHWQESLRRARLTTDAVKVERLGQGAALVRVSEFTEGSGAQVRRAVEREVPEGAGILLDLRGNSGGLVGEATRAASAFLDGGLVATYEDDGEQRALYAGRGGETERPLVVLVDGGTMSAAELLAGALQDRGRAVVVGSRSFGKGSVQIPRKQPDGSVAELTVGHYATPSGRRIDGKGITPDLSVGLPERAAERGRTVLGGLSTRS